MAAPGSAGSAPRRRPDSRFRSGPGSGSGSSPPENNTRRSAGCPELHRPGASQRLRRRSDPGRSSCRPGWRDGDSRREIFISPAASTPIDKGVLSDSENEEPISRRIRNISAFIRKTKNSAAFSSGSQRSQSCSDSVDRGLKLKVTQQLTDRVGISHSSSAGILLSSENSRSVSAPLSASDRQLPWRAVVLPQSVPLVQARPERSISPESNDSISEELNHFKPIVCSPCTPPKRLADGRLLEPTVVKSTPRNLTRGLQKATSYEASPAVLQKWRQIELDRQSLRVNSRATLTSPVPDCCTEDRVRTRCSPAGRGGDGVKAVNKRRLLFDPPESVKIRVPAIRYSETAFRGAPDFDASSAPESGGAAFLSRKQSFSPYTKNSGFQSCKLVPKDQSPRKESDGLHSQNQTTSRQGQKREQKTKHLDPDWDLDRKRSRSVSQEVFDEHFIRQVQQERQDRALALRLQRQFDLETQTATCRRSPDAYFLRSWMSNQNRRRWGLRRSRRINKKH